MAEPIVRTFVIDTTQAEQNLTSLGTTTKATTAIVDSLYNELIRLDQALNELSPNDEQFQTLATQIKAVEESITSIETGKFADIATDVEAVGNAISGVDTTNVEQLNQSISNIDTGSLQEAFNNISEISAAAQDVNASKLDDLQNSLAGIDAGNLAIISTEIESITTSIDSVDSANLVDLQSSVDSLNGDDLSNVASNIESINEAVGTLDSSNIASVQTDLDNIDTKTLSTASTDIENINESIATIDSGNIEQLQLSFNEIDTSQSTQNLNELSNQIGATSQTINDASQSFNVDTNESEQNLEDLNAKSKDLGDNLKELPDNVTFPPEPFDQAKNSLDDIGDKAENAKDKLDDSAKSAKKLGENAKGAESGFKKVGSTLNGLAKATGVVALLTAAFNTVKSVIQSTQPIADAFSAAFGTFTDIIRDAFTYITDNAGTVVEYFEAIFNDPVQALKDFGDALVENLIERFNSFLDTLGFVAEGIKNLFTGEFDAALNSFKEAGKESIDVLTGVDDTVNKVTEAVTEGAAAFGKYVSETFKANEELVKLQNNAKLAAAEQARLAEQYDRQAELLRQTRDDESKSIEDRIEANTKLGKVLEKQEQAELASAQAQVAAAQATFQHNQTIDNQVALTQALANVDGVRAKLAGLKSEQLVNEIALNKELNELTKAQVQSNAELAIADAKFTADSIKNDLDRLNAQRAVLEQEKIIALDALQAEIDKYNTGTQARLDAEIAYAQKKQEIDQNLATSTIAIQDATFARQAELQRLQFENLGGDAQARIDALNVEYAEKERLYANDAAMLEAIENEKARKVLQIEQDLQDAKLQLTSDALGAISGIVGSFAKGDEKRAKRAFQIQKGLSIAQATVDTYKSANAIFAAAAANPATILFPAQPFIAAGAAIAAGIANVTTIASQQFQGGGSPGGGGGQSAPSLPDGGGGGGGSSQPAQFNPLAASFLQDRPEQVTPRAYVLAGDVASQQEVREKVQDLARIG